MTVRAGNLIFAAAFVSSLLGGRALSNGFGLRDWLAVLLLFALGAHIAFLLWPYHQYRFHLDPEELLKQYIDGDAPATVSEDRKSNWRIIQRLHVALQLALILLLLDILAWLFAIAQA